PGPPWGPDRSGRAGPFRRRSRQARGLRDGRRGRPPFQPALAAGPRSSLRQPLLLSPLQNGAGLQGCRAPLQFQSNRLETECSSLMRFMASATSGAIVIWRMLWQTRTASVAVMLSVPTSSFSGEDATRATAPPENPPCVTYADTDSAPSF